MLVIRLARVGRHKYPTYRIVAAEKARPATGKFVRILGNYNPHTKDLVLKTDEITAYIKNGAQPSNRLIKLLQQEKVDLPEWAKLKTKNKQPKKAVEAAPAAEAAPAKADEEEVAADVPEDSTEAVTSQAVENSEQVAQAATDDNTTPTAESEAAEAEAAQKVEETATEVAAEVAEEANEA